MERMKKAENLEDFYSVFMPNPLSTDEMDLFYCGDTIKYRTGDESVSPIDDIRQIMTTKAAGNAGLLLGHRGCGKSTELVKLRTNLQSEGYKVESINCKLEMDLVNIDYWDLFTVMAEKLIGIAKDLNCEINKEIIEKALSYWDDKTTTETTDKETEAGLESEVSAGAGILGFFNAFIRVRSEIKNRSTKRTEIITKFEPKMSEWIAILELITKSIQSKSDGKMPILILEELDKITSPEKALEIFYNNADAMSKLPFKAIYTFPINLYYSEKFATIKNFFHHEIFPMIKVHNKDMSENTDGINIIKEIVYKRADEHFFDDEVLEYMIIKTGGALRDLFEVIRNAGNRANKRKAGKIYMEDAVSALNRLKSDLTRVIEVKYYDFLKDVYIKKEQIEDSAVLLKFMEALVVLEYNGNRWHDLHPLIYDFFDEQGIFDE